MVQRFGLRRECIGAVFGAVDCSYFVEPSPCPVDQLCRPGDLPPGGEVLDPNLAIWDLIEPPGANPDNRAFHVHVFDDGGTPVEGTVFADRITDPAYPYHRGLPQIIDAVALVPDLVVPAILHAEAREFISDSSCTAPNDCWHTAVNTFGGGGTPVQVDEDINRVSSLLAIPPDIIKAQGYQESGTGAKFDPNVVRYEPLTGDYRYFAGEFDETEYDAIAAATYCLPGPKLLDPLKPPEAAPPRSQTTVLAGAVANTLTIPGCADCGFKLFFGNPGGIPGNCAVAGGDACDGADPANDPLSAGLDPDHEMEFRVLLNGVEVDSYLSPTWYTRVGGLSVEHIIPAILNNAAAINPRSGEVTYHGPVGVGDTLALEFDGFAEIQTRSYPLGSLIEVTDIIQSINGAENDRPYFYPAPSSFGYGHTFGDLNAVWYPGYPDPRTEIGCGSCASENNWRLDASGRPLDPKFDVAAQFVWGQAFGVFQFQLFQLVAADWGVQHLQFQLDENNVVQFDLFDEDMSLPLLLGDFRTQLEFYRLMFIWAPHIPYSLNPCVESCSHDSWLQYIRSLLTAYNGDAGYPNHVFRWLETATNGEGVAFGGNVPYPLVP